jgi:threonine aldolase
MEPFDFRSDTVTKPTPEMREAMENAVVGDDVYGEDPTINLLQETAAKRMGMEAGLFVPSGTMGNLIAVLAHCGRGDEVILGKTAHTFLYEVGGISALGGVHSRQLDVQPDGTLALEDVEMSIRGEDVHNPATKLITIENTHNRGGGVAIGVEYTQKLAALAKKNKISFHIDGARIFNAAVWLGVEVSEIASPADSITFCLSKGLSAPVGSVLCGSADFIFRARKFRKQLGGGMRQAGIIASAGLISLDKMVDRLKEDHALAKTIVDGLNKIPLINIDVAAQHTNMIFFNLHDDAKITDKEFVSKMAERQVLLSGVSKRRFRMVTHCWVGEEAGEVAVTTAEKIVY